MATSQLLALLVGLAALLSVAEADSVCASRGKLISCSYGCCSGDCCSSSDVGLIVGLTLGGVAIVVSIIIIVVCCIVRRRRLEGTVMRSTARPAMVVYQPGATAPAQPGMIHPPYQPYPGYPANYGNPQGGYPQGGYPKGGYQAAYQPQGISNPIGSSANDDAPRKG